MFLPPLSKGEEGRGRIACARFNTKARTNARFSHSCRATCRNSTYYYTEIPYRKRRRRREKEKRVSTKPFPSCASTLADTGCYATHELDAMHSGWACGDFIITSSLPTECIRIEKCAGLFFSYRGYRDNARMPVTRARIHPSFGRERERFPSSRLHRSRFFSSFRHGFQAVRVAPSTFVEKVGDVFRSPRDKDNEREREREGS